MPDETKPQENAQAASSPDALVKDLDVKLSEEDATKVTGGKAKTADKAFQAMDGYIRG